MDMRDIESQLTSYADGELSESDAASLTEYLNDHPEARSFVETQKALRHTLSTKTEPLHAPSYLKNRVLDRITSTPTGLRSTIREWLSAFRLGPAPSIALIAVTIIAIASAVSSVGVQANTPAVQNSVVITGEIQCIDCAVAQQWGVSSECDKYGHRNGIVAEDGTMWTVKHSDRWAPFVHDTSIWGTVVTVDGHQCGAAHYVDIRTVEFESPTIARVTHETAYTE
jgi:hypothetical protein